jgi:hypothetical protein
MHKPNTVRIADNNDVEALFWQLVNDYDFDNGVGWTVAPLKVLGLVRGCCQQDGGIAGIIDGLDGPIGSIGIEIHNPRYSNDDYLVQAWMFVLPEHRAGKQHWYDLFAFAEWYRSDMAQRLQREVILESSVVSNARLDAKIRLWRRRAGRQIGAIFWSGEDVAEKPQS